MITGAAAVWKALPTGQRRMIVSLSVAVAIANIAQPYPDLAPLQHGPTVILIVAAPWVLARWPLSTPGVASIWLFLLLHTLGARYIYSYVPYDDWLQGVTGWRIGGARNDYDRFVHLAFGGLLTLPVAEFARRWSGMGQSSALLVALLAIGFGSALYEIFEWLLTIVAAGSTADYYNGQQGDGWDAQKDMALALLGSSIAAAAGLAGTRHRRGSVISGESTATDDRTMT
ncbi:DUF2238 domain-containing protein [Sphingobium sp. AN641]|uniref:DUF2238 domain-containing protein n=1 Tax=Sphingobium sp. AN641 TaxID=3133443 RepID=UPI0030BAC195